MSDRSNLLRPFALALVLFALACSVLWLVPHAFAQHSGGSFGGSHFGSGGGGGGGGFGAHGGGGFGGHGGSLGGYGGGHGSGVIVSDGGHLHGLTQGAVIIFAIAILLAVLVPLLVLRDERELPGPEARAWMYVDVTSVRIAVDATARTFIQGQLAKLARRPTRSRAQLHASLRRVVGMLRKCDAAWIYGGATNFRPMNAPVGEAAFRRLANDARSKFQRELVRNADGRLVLATAEPRPNALGAGPGVALVTVVVAAKREIIDFDGGSRASLGRALGDLDALTVDQLIALEVVWSPADEAERVSTRALEALHPDLMKLPGAIGGRVDCSYCRGPFAAELPTCPHCGASAPESGRAPDA
jgi:uncharacterized membrane protein